MKKRGVIFAITRDNKVLMQQRDKNCKKFPFMWCVPGGGSNLNEDYMDTLLREVKEEYDITLEAEQCTQVADYDHDRNKLYVCKINQSQEPKLKEGLAMKWMTFSEIENLELGFNQNGITSYLKKVIL